ncbi:protein adenylyltransferase SelO [Aliidiomarina quisquiliarum]|uniref:protein adenylyltransferase SelO n=1 Tax=Aliidiomarina quisquiliarum TaxID=2938947 RepID=UPI00208F21B3|nr:YdiU family protein [Aliidiomarina quisquiliarum]MCO4321049.1 YdiU family protein [Aliidiomarina quisquiliarum]
MTTAAQPQTKKARTSYRALPDFFFADARPSPAKAPQWIAYNHVLAAELQLPTVLAASSNVPTPTAEALEVFSGNAVPEWSQPFSQAYAGHQFGHFNPQLGDGRAIMLCEVLNQAGELQDVQLKGAGRTTFSRSGDGRSPIGPVLREYLVSETMHQLGVPTTRALAAVATGNWVYREKAEPGAILTRVASSHIRVGTFQFAAVHGGTERVKQLADYVIQRHYPELAAAENPYLELIATVLQRQANLVAHWMSLGFIHGVMNTDNTSVYGETIDYGPCAFMDHYAAAQVYSFIDKRGRYSYVNQPIIAQWNVTRFAESLAELIRLPTEADEALLARLSVVLDSFQPTYQQLWLTKFAQKIGIHAPLASDRLLIEDLLELFETHSIDFTLGFRLLAHELSPNEHTQTTTNLFSQPELFSAWKSRWLKRVDHRSKALIERVNPAIIPRNHFIAKAINEASSSGNLAMFQALLTQLQTPFDSVHLTTELAQPPAAAEQIANTFCGT